MILINIIEDIKNVVITIDIFSPGRRRWKKTRYLKNVYKKDFKPDLNKQLKK